MITKSFSMLIIKEVFSFFLRETIIFSREFFKNCLSSEISIVSKLKHVIQILIEFIHDIDSVIVDGTGIGFKKKTSSNWMRGSKIGKVKDHIRYEVVMEKGRYKMIIC